MCGYDTTLYQNQSGSSTELSLVVGQQDGQGKKREDLSPHTNAGTAVLLQPAMCWRVFHVRLQLMVSGSWQFFATLPQAERLLFE